MIICLPHHFDSPEFYDSTTTTMSVHGQDVRLCLSRALKLISEICVSFLQQHPILSVSIFSVFLLYITFPFAFWVLVYSIPLVVCTAIFLSITFNANQHRDEDNGNQTLSDSTDGKKKKPITRVQSVRRRRAKEFTREPEEENNTAKEFAREPDNNSTQRESEEENNILSSTDHNSLIDKSSDIIIISSSKGVKLLNDEDDHQKDHQKNKMDAAISDSERTKRLESLIARRRSRKLISLEFRKALMNKVRNQDHQSSSVFVPKSNMGRLVIPSSHSEGSGGTLSPVPGSAPPVLIPMKNPFDLPYDPHEEKPDLSGDSFEQEFMPPKNRDLMMFSRHQSFSSGPSLPSKYSLNLKEASFDRELAPINENENHIKETIHSEEGTSSDEDEDAPVFKLDREAILRSLSMARGRNPMQEQTENPNNDQLEEHMRRLKDGGYYTDKTRNRHSSYSIASDLQVEVSEIGENSSYLDNDEDSHSAYDVDSQLDLSQVDEYESRSGFSRGEMPENTTILNESHCDHPWCSITEYPDSCRTTRSLSLDNKIDKTLQRSISLLTQTSGRYYSMKPEACSHRFNKSDELNLNTLEPVEESATTDDEGHLSDECHEKEQIAGQSMMIPEDSAERLQPENQEMLTESSVIEDQIHDGTTQDSEGEQSSGEGTGLMANVAFEQVQISPTPKSVLEQESLEPSNKSTSEADEVESIKQHEIHENGVKPDEAACGSAQVPSLDEAPEDPTEETSSASLNMDGEASSSKDNLTAFIQSADHLNNSIPPLSTAEELSKHQEIPTGESTQDDDIDKSTSCEVQTEASTLHEEKGHGEHNLNNLKDQEGQENSTSDCLDGTKDKVSDSVDDRTTTFEVSGAVEDSVSTESYNKNEKDGKSQQDHSSRESMPIPQDRQVANDTLTEDTK